MSKAINPNTAAFDLGQMIGLLVTKIATVDTNGDGKVQATELMGAVVAVVLDLTRNFASVPMGIKELRDPNSNARIDLVAGVKEKFDIANEELEFLIEETLELFASAVDLVIDWKQFIDESKVMSEGN